MLDRRRAGRQIGRRVALDPGTKLKMSKILRVTPSFRDREGGNFLQD